MSVEKQILDNVEVEEVKIVQEESVSVEDIRPDFNSPDWHEFVMKQFQPDELVEGNPTTEGLRRVVSILLGDIIESSARCINAPCPNNNFSATIEHTIKINWTEQDSFGGDVRTFTEIADVNSMNCDTVFRKYPSATASTRAEGRALRKALKLKHVIAAEEKGDDTSDTDEGFAPINSQQIMLLNHMCKKNNINVIKFINIGENKYNKIDEVGYNTAVKMVGVLNEYVNDKSKISEDIKGYKSDWRN